MWSHVVGEGVCEKLSRSSRVTFNAVGAGGAYCKAAQIETTRNGGRECMLEEQQHFRKVEMLQVCIAVHPVQWHGCPAMCYTHLLQPLLSLMAANIQHIIFLFYYTKRGVGYNSVKLGHLVLC